MKAYILRLCRADGVLQQAVIGQRGEVEAVEADPVDIGVGGGAHGDDDIPHPDRLRNRPATADPDDALHAECGDQFGAIDAGRGYADAVGHYGDFHALVGTGETEHVADVGHLAGVSEILLCDIFRP